MGVPESITKLILVLLCFLMQRRQLEGSDLGRDQTHTMAMQRSYSSTCVHAKPDALGMHCLLVVFKA